MLRSVMENENISTYTLAKKTGIPYSTLSDIVSGKTAIQNVSASVLYRLSAVLGVSMEQLYLGKEEKKICYLCNEGREVIINAAGRRFSYQGPKNLVGFRNISAVRSNVLYVDTWFTDTDMRIYVEEDYIDLNDVMCDHDEFLNGAYQVVIGLPGESRKQFLCENALLVSDNIAIMPADNGTSDIVIEAVNIKRNSERMLLRLRDTTVLFSNMSRRLEKRAMDAAERNIALITEEIRERKHA